MYSVRGTLALTQVFLALSLFFFPLSAPADEPCLACHSNSNLETPKKGVTKSLFVDKSEFNNSVHSALQCTSCHENFEAGSLPHLEKIKPVNCGNCHGEIAEEWRGSVHKRIWGGEGSASNCTNCHGTHNILSKQNDDSPTARMHVPELCSKCHTRTGKAAVVVGESVIDVYSDYSKSVHGKGLSEKGLIITAICIDCHSTHNIRQAKDPLSTVNPENVPHTCGKCHKGIEEKYSEGVHKFEEGKNLPTCAYCHSAHDITRVDMNAFVVEVAFQCGRCHQQLAETYVKTIHGQANQLGYDKVAKCSDCHEPHDTKKVTDPASAVSPTNRVVTCAKCHADSNKNFAGYITHASPHEKSKNPALYYILLFMEILLYGVFGFFGIHTLLWLPRSFQGMLKRRKREESAHPKYIRRFSVSQRITHLFVVISFITLAFTGMMLKYSYTGWAKFFANILGGVPGAGLLHRIAAIITFGYFGFHLFEIYTKKKTSGKTWIAFLLGENTMVPTLQDLKDFVATIKWFLWLGPRPHYGRWTYWEKFDYFAVFWGVAIIGLSGLVLWMPEFFTSILPGWAINVAMIVHSEEALLAVGFIFTIHFFHTHLRPETFPMDKVIFSGLFDEEQYREERSRDYNKMQERGELAQKIELRPIPKGVSKFYFAIGALFLLLGTALIFLIFYTAVFGFK